MFENVTVDSLLAIPTSQWKSRKDTAVHVSLSSDLIVKQRISTQMPTKKRTGCPAIAPQEGQEGRWSAKSAAGVERVLEGASACVNTDFKKGEMFPRKAGEAQKRSLSVTNPVEYDRESSLIRNVDRV